MLTCLKTVRISVAGDGAYDKFGFRKTLGVLVKQHLPPPSNAVIKEDIEKTDKKTGKINIIKCPEYLKQRNEAIKRIDLLFPLKSFK